MVLQFETVDVIVPGSGEAVPLVSSDNVHVLVIRPEGDIYVVPQDAIGNDKGLLVEGGCTLGFGAADFGGRTVINLYAVAAVTGAPDVVVKGLRSVEVD